MSKKINIYETIDNVMRECPYDSDDAVVGLGRKDKDGFIDCYELFYEPELEDDEDEDEIFEKRIEEALNDNGLYLAIAFGEDGLGDYGITIDKDFNMHFAKRFFGSFSSGQYCEIAFEELDAGELIHNYLSTIKYDD